MFKRNKELFATKSGDFVEHKIDRQKNLHFAKYSSLFEVFDFAGNNYHLNELEERFFASKSGDFEEKLHKSNKRVFKIIRF